MKINRSKVQKVVLITGLVIIACLATWAVASKKTTDKNKKEMGSTSDADTKKIANYNDCKAENSSKMLQTYPLQCVTADGVTFTDPSVVTSVTPTPTKTEEVTPTPTPKPTTNEKIKDLMADVACRTSYITDKQDIDTAAGTIDYADLNGDMTLEALVGLHVSGTGKYGVGCVYTLDGAGALKLLWKIPESDVLAHGSFKVNAGNYIVYTGVSASNTEPSASATPDTTITYKWTGSTFSKQ